MEHPTFVTEWQAGRLNVSVDRSLALQVANSDMLPRRFRFAHIFWTWVWFLSIPAAFAVMYFFRWWAGLFMLLFLPPVLSKAIKMSAMEFMIDRAIESPDFYQWAVERKLLIVSSKV